MARLPLLRTVEDVIELCLCNRYVPAFHFVYGAPGVDAQRFKSIMRGGHLKPASETSNESMFIYDVLAGDDQYVFLAPVRTPMGMGGGSRFGFVFDADELLRSGALYGESDLLTPYEKAAHDVFERHYLPQAADEATILGRQKNSPRDREDFLRYRPRWGHNDNPLAVRDLIVPLREALQGVQETHRVFGEPALVALAEWAQGVCAASQQLVAQAQRNVAERTDRFTTYYESYARASRPWPEHKRCYVAARDSVAGERLYTNTALAHNPEILWPGRLPLTAARAAFALPKGEYISWPDDMFRLACLDRIRDRD